MDLGLVFGKISQDVEHWFVPHFSRMQRNPGQKKRIVYGSTEISAAKVFLDQLEQLGASAQ